VEACKQLAEAFEHSNCAPDGFVIDIVLGVESGGEPDGFFEPVNGVDLGCAVVLHNSSYRKPEAVRAQVDCGK
jgi:hypothetical protein